jgi:hypothetical protein
MPRKTKPVRKFGVLVYHPATEEVLALENLLSFQRRARLRKKALAKAIARHEERLSKLDEEGRKAMERVELIGKQLAERKRLLVPVHASRAIARIGDALALHAPDSAEVLVPRPETIQKFYRRDKPSDRESQADVVVMLVNGLHDHFLAQAARCRQRGQKYAVVQIALRTTRHPNTEAWRELWRNAAVVWTYYPLDVWIKEDGGAPVDFNFYHAPLGVDPKVFNLESETPYMPRTVMICTSGARLSQESTLECDRACRAVDGVLFQLGPKLTFQSRAYQLTGIPDKELAEMYRRCKYVSGLRRHEGFELPAAEGLMCGARPVLYDKPHYRTWYDGHAIFIPEGDPAEVVRSLTDVFSREPDPVGVDEFAQVARKFNWKSIASGFWERALA